MQVLDHLLVYCVCFLQSSSKLHGSRFSAKHAAVGWESKGGSRYFSTAMEGNTTVKSSAEVNDGGPELADDLEKSLEALKPKADEPEIDHSMDFLSLETKEKSYQPDRGGYKV